MLARSQKDCEKYAEGMQRAEEGDNKDENITVDVLTRSQLQSKLATKQTESLLILTAEDINRPDLEQSSEKSSQSVSGDNHSHQRKCEQVANKSSAPHKQMSLYRNISNALITHFLNLQSENTWCKKKK